MGFIPKVVNGVRGFQVLTGGGTSIMARIAPTLYEFVPVEEYLKVTEALIRVFHRTNELRKNRMKARVKFYIDRIGIDEFRKQVEEELKEPWAQRSFDPKDLLFIEDEAADAPALDGDYRPSGGEPEFQTWLQTNVETQKQDGYRAVIAPSRMQRDAVIPAFADIFRNNSAKNGLLTVELEEAEVEEIFQMVGRYEGLEVTVDLDHQRVTLHLPEEISFHFEIDPAIKDHLTHGRDPIGITLHHEKEITAFESHHNLQRFG